MQIIDNKLIADDGMTLTNGEAFGKVVHLASGASAEDWHEVTDAEADVMRRDLMEAEAEDYENALAELGVDFDAE